jgi:hypothetical protein
LANAQKGFAKTEAEKKRIYQQSQYAVLQTQPE